VTTTTPPWVIIANYPVWPSPYFAHLERYWAVGLPLAFRSGLGDIDPAWPPGVINLHRLKRLYRDPGTGAPTMPAARVFLARLAALKEAGWRVAWTVHGLLPTDGPPPGPADRAATAGVLELADAVLCHTRADARALEGRTRVPAWVVGWSCLDPPGQPPAPEIAALAAEMRRWPLAFLLLGNLTAYKDVPAVAGAFLSRTRRACLAVAGDCPGPQVARALERAAAASGGRILLHPRRVDPGQAGHLYAAAHAAVCPYRTDGRYKFLADIFYPGSVGTAAGFGVPVIAPALAAAEEITGGQPRWLARPGSPAALGDAMAAAENALLELAADGDPRDHRTTATGPARWQQTAATYNQAARWLARQPGSSAPQGEDDRSA
jgi:glycosyltransferase involved in cell wall biosynthesis